MFCCFSCLVWDKALPPHNLHLSVCRQCISPDKFTYGGGRKGGWDPGKRETQLYSSSILSQQKNHSNAASSYSINKSQCIFRSLTKKEAAQSRAGWSRRIGKGVMYVFVFFIKQKQQSSHSLQRLIDVNYWLTTLKVSHREATLVCRNNMFILWIHANWNCSDAIILTKTEPQMYKWWAKKHIFTTLKVPCRLFLVHKQKPLVYIQFSHHNTFCVSLRFNKLV